MNEKLEKLREYLDSPEGKKTTNEYFGDVVKKRWIKEGRFEKFDKWFKNKDSDFDKLLYRLILQHDDEYIEKCYHNGYEPHMNNVLSFVFDYCCNRGKPVKKIPKELKCDFPQALYEFRGYYFEIIWGQGSMSSIYNKEDLRQIY